MEEHYKWYQSSRSMAEGTRFRDLQDSVTAFKLHQEKTTSNLEQATEGLRKQQEQMQAQTNLHDKKLDDLSEKMDKLIEVLGSLQTQKHQTEDRTYQENKEKEYKLYQASQKKLREEQEEAYQRKQEENQENLRSWDNLLEIMQELVQEEERNEQLKKAEEKIQEQEQNTFEMAESSNPLGGIDDQTESIGDFNPNDVHDDEFLDLSREIEFMEFKNVLLISEKVEIKEEIKKLKMEQEFVKSFSDGDGLFCNAEKVFDRKLKRQWVFGAFYLWDGGWCFDPGKKLIFLEQILSYLNQHNNCNDGASDLSKNLESMELDNDSSKLFDPGKNLIFLKDAMIEIKSSEGWKAVRVDSFNSEEHNKFQLLAMAIHTSHLFFFHTPRPRNGHMKRIVVDEVWAILELKDAQRRKSHGLYSWIIVILTREMW